MMQTSPVRHPLNERSVNTLIDPGAPTSNAKTNTTLKRQIHDVDNPEYPPSSSHFRLDQDGPRKGPQNVSIMTEKISPPVSVTANTQTTQPRQDIEEDDSQDTYKDSVLSGTDIDPMEDTMVSQQTAATEISQVDRSTASLAELLRLRLRVAMFKIRTGQMNIPMSQCVPPKSARFPLRVPVTQSRVITAAPKLLPAPVLQPTAYSARMTYSSRTLSSPPPASPIASSAGQTPLETKDPEDIYRTPALPRHKILTMTDHQLSTPPDGLQRMGGKGLDQDRELTSSTIRGNAARDLLGLMQSR